jgi:hypothetical protein
MVRVTATGPARASAVRVTVTGRAKGSVERAMVIARAAVRRKERGVNAGPMARRRNGGATTGKSAIARLFLRELLGPLAAERQRRVSFLGCKMNRSFQIPEKTCNPSRQH